MSADIQWNRQLIKRYGHAAATCSGYPSVSQFQQGFAALDLLRQLRNGHRPLQLAVSLPPEQSAASDSYLDCLTREADLLSCHLAHDQPVQRLHLAAGAIEAGQLQRLLTHLRRRFNIPVNPLGTDSAEVDPAQADWASMGMLRELGFNHISIGVPDACPPAPGVVVNFRDPRRTRWLIEAARALHFSSVNIDLGYGRAWQSLASFRNKVAAIVELQPERILLFDYAHPPQRYRVVQRSASFQIAAVADKLAMHQHAVEQLDAAGYCYLGLGQFALEDDPLLSAREEGTLRHSLLGYHCQPAADLLGLGMAAVSHIGALQLQNRRDAASYQEQLEIGQLAVFHGRHCAAPEQLQHIFTEALLCNFHVDLQALAARFGPLFSDFLAARLPVLEQMADDGLLELDSHALSILPAGRLLVGAVCKALEQGRAEPQVMDRRLRNLAAVR
jgi:oxygen-independent coproporphyrinogen-3 oxidase